MPKDEEQPKKPEAGAEAAKLEAVDQGDEAGEVGAALEASMEAAHEDRTGKDLVYKLSDSVERHNFRREHAPHESYTVDDFSKVNQTMSDENLAEAKAAIEKGELKLEDFQKALDGVIANNSLAIADQVLTLADKCGIGPLKIDSKRFQVGYEGFVRNFPTAIDEFESFAKKYGVPFKEIDPEMLESAIKGGNGHLGYCLSDGSITAAQKYLDLANKRGIKIEPDWMVERLMLGVKYDKRHYGGKVYRQRLEEALDFAQKNGLTMPEV